MSVCERSKQMCIRDSIQAVCSPGGTTIEGVHVFEAYGLNAVVAEASDKCIARAYELGK